MLRYRIEIEQEENSRWLAEVRDLPGVMVYGDMAEIAIGRVQALAEQVLVDRLAHEGC
jgi:predicted RNase H-like HicB family nuclease